MSVNKLLALGLIVGLSIGLGACPEGGTKGGGGIGGATGGSAWGGPGTGSGGGGNGGGGNGGGGNAASLTFAGPTDAAPTAIDSIAVNWNPAVLSNSSSDVIYDVFRAASEDMAGELLAGTTAPNVSSFVDSALASGTYFYRVAARTLEGLSDEPGEVVSANIPTQPNTTPIDYATTVEPLWSRVGSDGVTTCLTCHDSSGAISTVDLTSYDGLLTGVGTAGAPDSFITPGQGDASFRELISRLRSDPASLPDHRMWQSQAADYEAILVPWIDQGATRAADDMPPSFDAAALADEAQYTAGSIGATRIAVRIPHASDPETDWFAPQTFDQLSYFVFGGETLNTIDWDNPVKKLQRNSFPLADQTFDIFFDWFPNTGVFVVRPVDYIGNTGVNGVPVYFERAP